MDKVSVIVPVYKSEHTLHELFDRTKSVLESRGIIFEMVFVEDYSPDNSWAIIQELKRKFPENVVAIKLSKNSGQHNALMCGFNNSNGELIITIDDDLQTPPEEIFKLLDNYYVSNADMVYGIYEDKQHSKVRNIGSQIIKRVAAFAFNARPDGSSFRLMKASLVHKLINHKQSYVFIDGLIHWHTSSISYQVVNHLERQHGKSNYTLGKLIGLSLNLLFNFTVLPLRIITFLGISFSVLSFLFGIYFIYRRLVFDVPLGYTSIIVSVFFSSSIILMSVGVIGEYLSRIYMHQNDRPQFSIQEILK